VSRSPYLDTWQVYSDARPEDRSSREPRSLPKAAIGAVVFVTYLIPSFAATWTVWTSHPTTVGMGGQVSTTTQGEWYMRWFPWAIAHGHDPLITHWINVPFGVNLVDNTSTALLAMVAIPITEIWGPVASINFWWLMAFPLSACGAYALARRFTTGRPAAWVAGLLYGFSPYIVGQGLGHLMLIFVPLPPLIFLVLHDLFVRQDRSWVRSGLLLALLVILQFFISTEVLATTIMFAVVATIVIAIWARKRVAANLGDALRGVVLAAVVCAVVLAYPLYLGVAGPAHILSGLGGFGDYTSALVAPLLPSSNMLIAPHRLAVAAARIGGNGAENGTYLGLPLVLLALMSPFLVKRREVRILIVLATIAFILSLGPTLNAGTHYLDALDGHRMPAYLIGKLPVLSDAYPVRYSLFVVLFVSVALAITLDTLLGGGNRRSHAHHRAGPARLALPAIVAIVVLIPLIPKWPYTDIAAVDVPAFFTSNDVDIIPSGSVALVYPFPMDQAPMAELWQAESGFHFRMPGGYFVQRSGSKAVYHADTLAERTLTDLNNGVSVARTPALRASLRAELGAWHVHSVVAKHAVGADPVGFFTWLIGRPPTRADDGGMALWVGTTWT
jgi:hypothetical protein